MQALQYLDAGRPELIEVPTPEPGPDEILVKVEAVTTCPHWDLHLMAGEPMFPGHQLKFPYSVGQPGHEALGEVAAVGDGVEDLAMGQRVIMWRDRGHNLPGCYAQYVVATPEDALPVPTDLPDEKLASLELAMCVQVSFGFRHWGGLSLLGYERHNRPAAERALSHIVAGKLDLCPLVSAKLALSQYAEGVAMLRGKKALKICFLPWSPPSRSPR